MGKTFVCSLCRNGIIGGGLYIDEQSITYSTQKLLYMKTSRRILSRKRIFLKYGHSTILKSRMR